VEENGRPENEIAGAVAIYPPTTSLLASATGESKAWLFELAKSSGSLSPQRKRHLLAQGDQAISSLHKFSIELAKLTRNLRT
jgi:hypothetical protein